MVYLLENTTEFLALSERIKESFRTIDKLNGELCGELRKMRDQQLYQEKYESFQEYCETELAEWGGHRRINQLLAASEVVEKLKDTQYAEVIKNERQARPLGRLIKFPDKLEQAVAIAVQNSESPTSEDFKKAVQMVAPSKPRTSEPPQEPRFSKTVTVTNPNHPKYNQSGTIAADPPNNWQQIVDFGDGDRLTVSNSDLDINTPAPQRTHTPTAKTYTEDELQAEINRAIAEAKIGFKVELEEIAQQAVSQKIKSLEVVARTKHSQLEQLHQRIQELEAIQPSQLMTENQQLHQRIEELERALEIKPQEWGNTFNKQAEKVLNKEVKEALEQQSKYDLRELAQSPPKESHRELLRLLGLSLANMAQAMPRNTKLKEAVSLVMGVEAEDLPAKVEQLHQLPQAVQEVTDCVKAKPSWEQLTTLTSKYNLVKQELWLELDESIRQAIDSLKIWSTPGEWEAGGKVCKYQKLGNFSLVHNGDRWLVVSPEDQEKFINPRTWLDWYAEGKVKDCQIAHIDQYTVSYNFHGTVDEIRLDPPELKVNWEERQGQLIQSEWYEVALCRIRM